MPAQPTWFERLDEILSALRSMTSTHLDRAAVEKPPCLPDARTRPPPLKDGLQQPSPGWKFGGHQGRTRRPLGRKQPAGFTE